MTTSLFWINWMEIDRCNDLDNVSWYTMYTIGGIMEKGRFRKASSDAITEITSNWYGDNR